MKKNKASPNLENGFVRLPNELLEALMRLNLSPQEGRIFWVVIRETLGWGKKEKAISLARFSELTGIVKPHVCNTLKKLQKRRIVVRTKNKFGLQEDYLRWKGIKKLPKRAKKTIVQTDNVPQTGNGEALPKQAMKLPERPLPKQVTKPLPKQVIVTQTGNALPLPKQVTKLPEQVTNITQTGNGNPELVNEYKQIPAPKDIKDNIKDKERTTAKILLIFEGKTTTKKILKAIKDKDPDEMIRLAKYCQERKEKGLTKRAPGPFFRLAKKSARVPSTENKPTERGAMKKEKLPYVFSIVPDEVIEIFRKKGLKGQGFENALREVNRRYKDQVCHLSVNFDVPKEKLSQGEIARMVAIAKEMTK